MRIASTPNPPTEPFPAELWSLFHHLNSGPSSGGHPAKRRKTETEPTVDSVTIWQHVFAQTGPAPPGESSSFTLPNLEKSCRLRLACDKIAANADGPGIARTMVAITPRLPAENLEYNILLDMLSNFSGPSDMALAVLNARDTFWSNPNVEDACWLSCNGAVSGDKDTTTVTLTVNLHWNVSTTTHASQLSVPQRKFQRDALTLAYPDIFNGLRKASSSCSPQLFYEAAHVPDPDDTPPEASVVPGLASKLYPFQRRTVKWLLRREGVAWGQDDDGNSVTKEVESDGLTASSSFLRIEGVDGQPFYINPVLGKVMRDPIAFQHVELDFKGGILSEEMGLGKTVELVSLLSLHPQPPGPDADFDSYLGEQVKTTPATLIVAPSSLKNQWLSELQKHAPGLRVMLYRGLSQSSRDHKSKANALVEKLRTHDVVVTTYNVLTSELDYALGEPDRARRAPRKYHRPRSPLTQLRWWRVCMDEAQMIENGVSKSATLARLLPRVNAWGVTGTPVKDSVEGQQHLPFYSFSDICDWDR